MPKQLHQVGVRRSSREHFRRIGFCPRHGPRPVEGVDNDVVSLDALPDRIDRRDADFQLEFVYWALSGGCPKLAELQIDGRLNVTEPLGYVFIIPLHGAIPQIGFQTDDDLADGKFLTECRQDGVHVSRPEERWIRVPATIQNKGIVQPEHVATLSSRLLAGAQDRRSARSGGRGGRRGPGEAEWALMFEKQLPDAIAELQRVSVEVSLRGVTYLGGESAQWRVLHGRGRG